MAKTDYVSQNDTQFVAQLQTFKTGIGAYARALGWKQPKADAVAAATLR